MAKLRAFAESCAPHVLSLMRIASALTFMQHGTHKMFDYPHRGEHEPWVLMTLTPGLTGVLEVFGGALLLVGLFTRPVAFILSGEMAVAYWMVHAPRSFFPYVNGGDAAILFCFIFLYLACAGPGPWSLDALPRRRRGT